MSEQVYEFEPAEPQLEPTVSLEPGPGLSTGSRKAIEAARQIVAEIETAEILSDAIAATAYPVVEIMPEGFQLHPLVKFIPNPAVRKKVDEAAAHALSIDVKAEGGLKLADAAVGALRVAIVELDLHFAEPATIANNLHKGITAKRAEWKKQPEESLGVVGKRIYTESERQRKAAEDENRRRQEEANRQAREAAAREAKAAEDQGAAPAVLEELQRQVDTASAPPVETIAAPRLDNSSTVSQWRARITGTPETSERKPAIEQLTPKQRDQVLALMRDVVDGKQPLQCFEINWPYMDKRAAADKSLLSITGFEAVDLGGLRGKPARRGK